MRSIEFSYLLACIVALLTLPSFSVGQETTQLSADQRDQLIAQRDALARQAIAKAGTGEFDGAQKLFDQVFQIETSLFGKAHEEILGTLDYQVKVADAAQDWQSAIEYRRRAYDMGKLIYPQGSHHLRDLELAVVEARRNAERTDEQRRLLVQAAVVSGRVVACVQQGTPNKAIAPARQYLALIESVLGKEHSSYASGLTNLAAAYRSMGDNDAALPLLVQAKTIRRHVLGGEHPQYAASINNLAAVHQMMGNYARAETLLVEAKAVYKKVLGGPSAAS